MPYVKSVQLFYCPDRVEGNASWYNNFQQSLGATRAMGYGYNWSPIQRRGGGLLQAEYWLPDGQSVLPGISLAAIQAPAQMFAFGDCYDTPRFTFDMTFLLCTYRGSTNAGLRHGGLFNVAFVDGHSKAVLYHGGYINPGAENNEFAFPANMNMITDYCADPNEFIPVNTADEGSPVGGIPGMQCNQIAGYIQANFPPCPPNTTNQSGVNCLWTQ